VFPEGGNVEGSVQRLADESLLRAIAAAVVA
jgi:hypothetical protein